MDKQKLAEQYAEGATDKYMGLVRKQGFLAGYEAAASQSLADQIAVLEGIIDLFGTGKDVYHETIMKLSQLKTQLPNE